MLPHIHTQGIMHRGGGGRGGPVPHVGKQDLHASSPRSVKQADEARSPATPTASNYYFRPIPRGGSSSPAEQQSCKQSSLFSESAVPTVVVAARRSPSTNGQQGGVEGSFSQLTLGSGHYAGANRSRENSDDEISRLMDDVVTLSFTVEALLGKGAYGKVFMLRGGEDSGAGVRACKVLNKRELGKERRINRVRTECAVMKKLARTRCPFLARLDFDYETPTSFYFVLEFCEGGELFYHLNRMKRFPEHVVKFYTAELICALQALHGSNIIYRDLKPENIMLSAAGHIRLVDYGLALPEVESMDSGVTGTCGTFEYLAPEVLLKQEYGKSIDIWSLGMVMFEMLTGLPPWYSTDKAQMRSRILYDDVSFPSYVPTKVRRFIERLLRKEAPQRLGNSGGMATVKQSNYFAGFDWDLLQQQGMTPPFQPCKDKYTGVSSGRVGGSSGSQSSSVVKEKTRNFSSTFTRVDVRKEFRHAAGDACLDLTGAPAIVSEQDEIPRPGGEAFLQAQGTVGNVSRTPPPAKRGSGSDVHSMGRGASQSPSGSLTPTPRRRAEVRDSPSEAISSPVAASDVSRSGMRGRNSMSSGGSAGSSALNSSTGSFSGWRGTPQAAGDRSWKHSKSSVGVSAGGVVGYHNRGAASPTFGRLSPSSSYERPYSRKSPEFWNGGGRVESGTDSPVLYSSVSSVDRLLVEDQGVSTRPPSKMGNRSGTSSNRSRGRKQASRSGSSLGQSGHSIVGTASHSRAVARSGAFRPVSRK